MTKVLLVDDERCLLDALSTLLADEGFEISSAFNGREALERLATFAADVVVSDVMMPVMDGQQLLRRLREQPATRGIPVILMTAAQLLPFDGVTVLRKPFHGDDLVAEIRRAVGDEPGDQAAAPLPSRPPNTTAS
jgi:CheY-like chemotaxis protein